MRRPSLGLQVFLSVVIVALGAVVAVGVITRNALSAAFDAYLASLPAPNGAMAGRPHMGRMMLGAAEQTFVATVDNSVYIAAAIAVLVAAGVALLLARYLTRPIRRLETAAEGLAAGDLAHRVDASGPAEVAALGDAFNRMATSLEESQELRRRMVADVSHELRNPIAAARAQAEGMADGVLEVDSARLNSLVEDLQHLTALVDDLQELAIADAGELAYDTTPVDVAELVRREVDRAAATAPSGVAVSAEGEVGPVEVRGDERRLSEVMRNLLSNAVRHTAAGFVTARVSVCDDGHIEVSVADSGEGIPEADIPFVFERFYRADSARAAHTGGSGLGLAITRRIVEDHGGEVFARSAPGGGAVVGFRLPPLAASPE
jgi:two-component system, OmpR family, sensor histidine kinase BaeS